MINNRFKYIKFENYTTYFDDYFNFLDMIKDNLPQNMNDFFCNKNRYLLQTDITLHNAWIENFNIINKYVDNDKFTTVEITLLLGYNSTDKVKLIYTDVTNILYESEPIRWVDKAVDLLTHELNMISDDNYKHIMEFDSDVWLSLDFKEFSYEYY